MEIFIENLQQISQIQIYHHHHQVNQRQICLVSLPRNKIIYFFLFVYSDKPKTTFSTKQTSVQKVPQYESPPTNRAPPATSISPKKTVQNQVSGLTCLSMKIQELTLIDSIFRMQTIHLHRVKTFLKIPTNDFVKLYKNFVPIVLNNNNENS